MGISNHTSKYGTSYNKQTQSTQSQTDEMFNELKRVLTERCHSPLVMEKEFVASSEGHFSTFEDYDIRMVQVVTRHGERAPMFATALIGMKIFYCPDGSRQLFSASDLSHTVCYKAQMTWTGCRQLQLIGRHFRKAYSFNLTVGQLENRIRLLSTGRQRTDWSARCLVAGLLGHTNYNKLVRVNLAMVPYALHTKYVKSCPYREKLLNQIRKNLKYQQSASYWTSAVNRGNSFITATGYNGRNLTYIHQFNEALVSHFCNLYHKGISASITPCVKKHCMPPSLSLEILKAADVHVKSQNDQKISLVNIQPLLGQIVSEMEISATGQTKSVFIHYSGHDITMSSLLSALGAFYGRQPAYATRLVFELWSERKYNNRYKVRVLHDGQVLKSSVLDEWMTLKFFKERILHGHLRDPKSHRNACLKGIW
ncbi:2-phosphoxylose phosphatase 1-like isoform X2 [Corticium candelabrum]|uniref:2-phosphoxylose phosphatase 1-like isoform X2 n=1 Tax=Corticium candelabrum TaxID=121492 RepID=UPI002E252E0B|nr:2-phosphoxylose phosphatase 1-like isoform X2 [Corticium candelabrum]